MDPTSLVPLGRTAVRVSRLGLGTVPIGGMFWAVDDATAAATIRRALDLGQRYLDTAPLYGHGLAERRLGGVLRATPREAVTVSTKVGWRLIPSDRPDPFFVGTFGEAVHDFGRAATIASVEASLEQLGLDRVDILLIHDPDDRYREAVEGAYAVLHELRAAGRVGAIGVGMNQWRLPARFVKETDVDCVLVADSYSLLDQPALTELLPACLERGVGVIVGKALEGGLLATTDGSFGELPVKVDERTAGRIARLAAVCRRHGVPLTAAAIQFAAAHPAVASVLVGCRSPEEVTANHWFASLPLPDALWEELRDGGLLRPDAPVPLSAAR